MLATKISKQLRPTNVFQNTYYAFIYNHFSRWTAWIYEMKQPITKNFQKLKSNNL